MGIFFPSWLHFLGGFPPCCESHHSSSTVKTQQFIYALPSYHHARKRADHTRLTV
ncbi:hypothetical protein PILCRDRAFT_813209 [Piloderma croceum F 1598]|uniref:Uncharacterized protein n=1 Tax=Piloderma croceum (strain F 1598) TaxID=765440 RepID=A0A0C3CHL0_PILCF|nr:hypothetical protein PILCRDRAFT_813209 [Piloderma croceum F 1598]